MPITMTIPTFDEWRTKRLVNQFREEFNPILNRANDVVDTVHIAELADLWVSVSYRIGSRVFNHAYQRLSREDMHRSYMQHIEQQFDDVEARLKDTSGVWLCLTLGSTMVMIHGDAEVFTDWTMEAKAWHDSLTGGGIWQEKK